ncbi:unnamed protein product, partial [Trichobilharzia szidati]
MLTFGFDRIVLLIFLQITVLPQRISGKNELAYLAKNKDENGSKFWLLQESDEYLITVLPQRISEEYELAYLVKNNDSYGSKFWLLQESDEYLSFSWITLSPSYIKPDHMADTDLFNGNVFDFDDNETSITARLYSKGCENFFYGIRGPLHFGRPEIYQLYYKR